MAEKQVSVRIKAEGGTQLKAEFQSIGSEAQKSFGQIDRGARLSGGGLRNAGYQVQDFAVQVASGTDVSRAFAQQMPQLLSGLGGLGILFGTVAAVAIPLFAAFGMGADKAKELDESVKDLNESIKLLNSATDAAQATPGELFSDFGAGYEQAREVLEIQRQIAAARAENALAKSGKGLVAVFGDPADLDLTLSKIRQVEAAIAAAQANPDQAKVFDFSQAERQLEFYKEVRDSLFSDIASQIGVELEGAETKIASLAEALLALQDADGARAQADAFAAVRSAILDAADAGGVLSDEALVLLNLLTDSELAALGLARADLASPISEAVGPAGDLAANLWDAAAAQSAFNRAHMEYGKVGARGDPRQFIPGGPQPFVASAEVVRLADEMLNPRPNRGGRGGGGGGGGVSEADREAKRIYDQTRTAAEKYAIELEKLNELHAAGKLDTDTYSRALEKLGKDLDKTEGLGKKAASGIRGAFDNLFDDPAQAAKDLSKQLFQMALYAQLAKSMPNIFGANGVIPLMNADGNVFDAGQVQAFAAGGIVSSATMFPMKGGMGVMGEAGPEAIMPLTRVGGKLGVAASGGGGSPVKVEINNFSGQRIDQSEGKGPNGERILRVAVGADLANGRHDGPLRSRFGTRPNPVKR